MIEKAARPIKISDTTVSPTMYEPIVEKSARITSPKSSPTAPPIGISPNDVLFAKATWSSAEATRITTRSPATRTRETFDAFPCSSGAAKIARPRGTSHAQSPTACTSEPATTAPTGPTQSAPVTSMRIGSPRNEANASDVYSADASSSSAAASRA